tara:strand:+ start:348 stop:587 length:240 start_codon:yes stop_codon:yes gene_type:complete
MATKGTKGSDTLGMGKTEMKKSHLLQCRTLSPRTSNWDLIKRFCRQELSSIGNNYGDNLNIDVINKNDLCYYNHRYHYK